jgi:hypothetical protein
MKSVFSKELEAIRKESHRSPRPTFGSPTLVWHIGIWPSPDHDWLDADIAIQLDEQGQSRQDQYKDICRKDADNKREFFEGINKVLQKLKSSPANQFGDGQADLKLGRPPGWVPSPNFVNDPHTRDPIIFPVVGENSLAFTLWWYSEEAEGGPPLSSAAPVPEAVRVRVQVEAQRDHITLTFYLDAGKPWNDNRISASDPATGALRNRILSGVQDVKTICEDRARSINPIEPLVPERYLGSDDTDSTWKAKSLLDTADFIYQGIWDAFLEDFGLSLEKIATDRGQIFANFRTAVISTSGLPGEPGGEEEKRDAFERFNSRSSECNAVLRGFWPFVRRMTPYADEKEHVACAVMGYRALYVTALNAYTNYVQGQECDSRLDEVPAGALPEMPDPNDPERVILPGAERFQNRPMRALLLTKGEPNTHQVGRIVERFNSLGTMRFFALKSYPLVRDASNHIRICGERLDEIIGYWTRQREAIEEEYRKKEIEDTDRRGKPVKILSQTDKDDKNEELSNLANSIENHLLDIHADLDAVSKRVPGGLLFRVTRSVFYADKIRVVVKLLKIENIETWVTYEQFLDRSVLPTYDFIERTGKRLEALRERLQVITQSIQTSSVYLQTLATRENTEELRNLASAQYRLAHEQEKLVTQQGRTNVVLTGLGLLIALLSVDEIFARFVHLWDALTAAIGAS